MKSIKYYKNRFEELKRSRSDFETDWKEINKYLAPATGCLFTTPSLEKDKHKYIYPRENLNGKPQRYMKNLATSLVATLCPPDSRWFGFSVPDETDEEQSWLHQCVDKVMKTFTARNLSSHLEALFYEGSLYGISAMSVEKSDKFVLSFSSFTIGQYWVDEDSEGNENTIYIMTAMNTRQLEQRFGYDILPENLRRELDSGCKVSTYNVIQAIEPNPTYLPEFKNAFNKPFVSCIWIDGISDDKAILQEKGMSDFPMIFFHWNRKINSVYTMGLGHEILGDVKELQCLERDTKRARAKKINPPLRADPSLRNSGIRSGSDDINWTNNKEGVTPLYNVNFDSQEGTIAIQEKLQTLYELTYNHLFSQIINRDKTMSATEVKKISQEELILLGGIVQNAMFALSQLCERAFKLMLESGDLPDNMPESLRGKTMNVMFHSLLAQSQSLSDLVLVERWLQIMSVLSSMNPVAIRKVDVFKIADNYARRLDIDMSQVISTEEVLEQVQAEQESQAQAAAAQQQLASAESLSSAAKNFAQAETIAEQVL